jgi:hypothetical protein
MGTEGDVAPPPAVPYTYLNVWPQRAGGAILDAMDQDQEGQSARDLPQPSGETLTDDDDGPSGDQEEPDAEPDFTGLPKSVLGKASLAMLAVFWIAAVIMLFIQGGK